MTYAGWMGISFNPLITGHHSLGALYCGFVHSLSGFDCETIALKCLVKCEEIDIF